MVDISTAMQAAAAEGRRKQQSDDGRKKRPGGKLGVENFDPREHVEKEKADTISMWLMLAYGCIISLAIRFVMMPGMTGPKSVLWSLPLLLVITIPSLHKVVVPKKFSERYTFGTWFKASMLFIFTWLALSFILTNPPLGDIAAPDIAGKMTVIMVDGEDVLIDDDNLTSSKATFTLDRNGSDGEAVMLLAVNDNSDAGAATLTVHSLYNEPNSEEVEVLDVRVSENSGCDAYWDGLRTSQQTSIVTHRYDECVAVNLGVLGAGEYRITITLEEDGDPWVNSREAVYTLTVV